VSVSAIALAEVKRRSIQGVAMSAAHPVARIRARRTDDSEHNEIGEIMRGHSQSRSGSQGDQEITEDLGSR
jgi:hypothetical protein